MNEFDINTLTLGEIEQVETLSRTGLATLASETAPKGKLMRALCFVVLRRSDPAISWESTADLSMADTARILGTGDESGK